MRITETLNLNLDQRQINFVDLYYQTDTTLFLDPFSFKKKQNPFCVNASKTIDSFFLQLKQAINQNDRPRVKYLLSHTNEARHLPLGYSISHNNGNGLGDELTEKLITHILDEYPNSFKDSFTILNDFGNIPGIKNDRISDILGNLIIEDLSNYTRDQCILHKKTNFLMTKEFDVWCLNINSWIKKDLNILNLNGYELFLIPRDVLRPNVINLHNPLRKFLIENELIKSTSPTLSKLNMLEVMSSESDLYTEFIETHIENDRRIKTVSREKLLTKINLDNIVSKVYSDVELSTEQNISAFKEIIEVLFCEYVTYPRINNINSHEYLIYDNLKEKDFLPKHDHIFFTTNFVHDVNIYKTISNDISGIGFIITDSVSEEEILEIKKLCNETSRHLLLFTIEEINHLVKLFNKAGIKNKFTRINRVIKAKLK
ncbi:MAG: hypothetical protein RR659_03340 [Bacilli bacterium]